MYNTISSFDANLARDPKNIVETKLKQDGRMVGLLKSIAGLYLLGACREVSSRIFTPVKSVIISRKLECK